MRLTFWKRLQLPFPEGWTPKKGERVIVPSVTPDKWKGWSATVEAVHDDIVTVRVPMFRYGRQKFLLNQIRPKTL